MSTATPKASTDENAQSVPTTAWQFTPNDPAGITSINVPSAGILYVNYEPQQVPKAIYVDHQNGSTTTINEGVNNISVSAQDFIVWQPFNPSVDSIKLVYQML